MDEQGIETGLFGKFVFVLLIGVINDHVFALLPPEDAAEAVLVGLTAPHLRSPKNDHDIKCLQDALRQPRSPYVQFLFPKSSQVPMETWMAKLSATPTGNYVED